MSRLKNPLLSLGAKGGLADSVTYVRRRGVDIVEKKPIPRDPQSLAQMYQRWDYQDGISYWNTLSNAAKQVYKSAASRYHMTGFAYFMRWYLKNLPDIAGRWRLDEAAGITAYDSSKNANHGTFIGTTPITGIIDRGRLFDGINDRIPCGGHSSLLSPNIGTVEGWIKGTTLVIAADEQATDRQNEFLILVRMADQNMGITIWQAGAVHYDLRTPNNSLDSTKWTFFNVWSDSSTIYASLNTVPQVLAEAVGVNDGTWFGGLPLLDHFQIGASMRNNIPAGFWDGDMDNIVSYNRVLSLQDQQRHYARQYPL